MKKSYRSDENKKTCLEINHPSSFSDLCILRMAYIVFTSGCMPKVWSLNRNKWILGEYRPDMIR